MFSKSYTGELAKVVLPPTLKINYNTIHLYGMTKTNFFSTLFKKNIYSTDLDYNILVIAEALYRLKSMELRNCSCMKCQEDKKKLEEFVNKKLKDV